MIIRNKNIEYIRIIAAYAIVAYHSNALGHEFAYSGLVVFLILSPYLDCKFNWDRPRTIPMLAKTLLAPWLFWLLAYGILNIVRGRPFFPVNNWIEGPLYGTSPHLWFMPAIFLALLAINYLKLWINIEFMFSISAVLSTLIFVTSYIWRPISLTWIPPWTQWAHAFPALLIGILLGLGDKVSRPLQLAAGLIVSVSFCTTLAASLPGFGVPYLIGTAVTVFAIMPNNMSMLQEVDILPFSSCMLGVYLSHIFFLGLFDQFFGHGNYLTVSLTFISATVFVFFCQRALPFMRLFIGSPPRAAPP